MRQGFIKSYSRKVNILIFFAVLGCARPNYQPINTVKTTKTCGLSFSNVKLCIDLIWENLPSTTEDSSFFLKFYSTDGTQKKLTPDFDLHITLFMPSMGHGSRPVQITMNSDGNYHVTQVYFIMHGEWQIRLQLMKESEIIDQALQNITL